MSGDSDINLMDAIEACRTCGVFFLAGSNFLRQIYSSALEDPDMMHIRMELSTWKVEIGENDGFPQYICTGCIDEFRKLFKFRRSCVDIQSQWRHFYAVREQHHNQIQIKQEKPDEEEENVCDFIYVDDVSDAEYDSTVVPFKIPHAPIKEEIIEEAKIPIHTPEALIDAAITNVQKQFCDEIENPENAEITSAITGNELGVGNGNNKQADQLKDNEGHTSVKSKTHIQCEFCDCISLNKYEHKLHMKHIHEIKDLDCHICGKTFKNSSAARLKFHLKWHKISKHRKCAQCGFFCNSKNDLREHTREMHSKVNCTECGKLVLPKKMPFHMRTHNTNIGLNCAYCTEVFNTLDEQKRHVIQNHGEKNSYEKTKIQEDNSLEHNLDSEVHNTFIAIGVVCATCDEKFSNQDELQLHVENEHYIANESPNRNSLDSFAMPQALTQMYCIHCNRSFNNEVDLAQHYQVSQCVMNKNAPSKSLNNSYINIYDEELENHSGTEQYAQVENYTYEAADLNDEINEEIDEEANGELNHLGQFHHFKCAQCSDTFENVDELRDHHEVKHSNKAVFSCHICGKVYELKFSLNRHLKKHNNA